MAVLEKRANLSLSDCDAYVNIAGGIRMNEPAIDLGIVLAIASSKKCIVPKVCLAGVSHISGIEIVGVANIKEAIEAVR